MILARLEKAYEVPPAMYKTAPRQGGKAQKPGKRTFPDRTIEANMMPSPDKMQKLFPFCVAGVQAVYARILPHKSSHALAGSM